MITGWNKLQLPLGAESHGRGAFTPPPPCMANRPTFKEQSFYLCKSHGDRGGLDNICFPELKATLVENLIGALMNATEILDGFEDPSGVPATVKQFLGFEAPSREQDLALASHSLPQSEPLELLFHERLSHGSSAQTSISPSFGNVISMPYCPQRNGRAHHAVQSSSALHVGGLSDCRQKFSVDAIHAADHGHGNSHISEEDLLLQEARSKAFGSRMEPNEVKGSSRAARMSHDGLAHAVPPDFKQSQAKDVSYGMARKDEVHAETGNGWPPFYANTRPFQQISLLWGSIALVMLLTGTLLLTCRAIFFKGRQLQRSSVKRRILKSHWYGNPGSNAWEHRNFQMKISEFPQYPLLEVDGDKKLLRVPSESAGISAAFARRGSQPLIRAQNPQKQPIRQSIHGMGRGHVSSMNKGQVQQPIRQTIKSSKTLCRKSDGFMKACPDNVSNGGGFAVPLPATLNGSHKALEEESKNVVPQQTGNGFYGRRVRSPTQDTVSEQRFSRMNASKSRTDQGQWGNDDELDLDRRIQKLYQTIQSVEQHRREAMIALEEERQRSLALEKEMSKQREVAALLGEEVRILKESHDALLTSLRKKYSTSAAARTAADLVYQDWERRVAAD